MIHLIPYTSAHTPKHIMMHNSLVKWLIHLHSWHTVTTVTRAERASTVLPEHEPGRDTQSRSRSSSRAATALIIEGRP